MADSQSYVCPRRNLSAFPSRSFWPSPSSPALHYPPSKRRPAWWCTVLKRKDWIFGRTFNLKVVWSFESKVRASSRRWELRVEGGSFESKVELGVELRVEGRTFESKVELRVEGEDELQVGARRRSGGERRVEGVWSFESKVDLRVEGGSFESKVGASSRRWDLRVEGRTSGLGPVYTTSTV